MVLCTSSRLERVIGHHGECTAAGVVLHGSIYYVLALQSEFISPCMHMHARSPTPWTWPNGETKVHGRLPSFTGQSPMWGGSDIWQAIPKRSSLRLLHTTQQYRAKVQTGWVSSVQLYVHLQQHNLCTKRRGPCFTQASLRLLVCYNKMIQLTDACLEPFLLAGLTIFR